MYLPTNALITVRTTAGRLGVPEKRVYELARENRLPGVVRLGRQIRFDPAKLEEFISSGGCPAGEQAD